MRLGGIAAALLALAPAHAQAPPQQPDGEQTAPDAQSPVGLGVTLGWEGRIMPGRWAPLRVTVIGREEAVAGTVRVEVRQWGAEVTRIEAPFVATPGAVTPVHMVVPLVGGWLELMDVRLLDDRGRRLNSIRYDNATVLRAYSQSVGAAVFIGVVGPSSARRIEASDVERGANPGNNAGRRLGDILAVQSVRPEDLPPNAMAYDALDALLIHASETRRVDDRARRAVLDWVRAGGRLAFVLDRPGDAHAAWLPEFVGVGEMSAHASGAVYRPLRIDGRAERAGWRTSDSVAAESPPAPGWLVEGPVGFGWITVYGADPQVLAPGAAVDALWETALDGAVGDRLAALKASEPYAWYGWDRLDGTSAVFDRLAASLDSAASLPFAMVLAFGVALALAVGPVDRFLFGRLRMLQRTWLTGAGWIAAFSVAAYAMPVLFRSAETQFRRVRVLDAVPSEGVATSTGATAVFSGERAVRSLTGRLAGSHWQGLAAIGAGGGALGSTLALDQGPAAGGGAVPGPLPMNVWTFRTLLDSSIDADAAVRVRIEQDASAEPTRYVVTLNGLPPGGTPALGGLMLADGWLTLDSWEPADAGWRAVAGEEPRSKTPSDWAELTSTERTRRGGRVRGGSLRASDALNLGAAGRRSEAIRRRVTGGAWGMVAVRVEGAAPDVSLEGATDARHWLFLRVLAPVETSP